MDTLLETQHGRPLLRGMRCAQRQHIASLRHHPRFEASRLFGRGNGELRAHNCVIDLTDVCEVPQVDDVPEKTRQFELDTPKCMVEQ